MAPSSKEAKFADLPAADAAPAPRWGAIGVIGIRDDMESDMVFYRNRSIERCSISLTADMEATLAE